MPSPKGYRLYVNELMEAQRLSLAETEKINQSNKPGRKRKSGFQERFFPFFPEPEEKS